MKSSVLTALGLLLSTQLMFAQQDNVHLLAQSPDGKTVKLIWFIQKWKSDITGFDIKRKEGLQDWVKLNTAPIVPEVSAKKKLSIVESDKTEESRIKAKLYELLMSRQMRETRANEYLRMLNSDEKAMQEIAIMISHDYDLALMNGFGYIDRSASKKTAYQYGLFIEGTNKLLDSITWNYGQIPDLNVVREVTSKAIPGTKGVQLTWNADLNKMKAGDVAGFDIYRSGIRLNATPIINVNNKDMSEFTWDDKSANTTEPVQYSISAESIFGIEGAIKPYTYEPGEHPKEYKKTAVTEVTSLGYYFKDGVNLKWTFPKEYERFISGFYVEKDNVPYGFKRVSALLPTSARGVVDTSASQVSGYIRFRISALYGDRTIVPGTDMIYSYFPQREPPAPQNVCVKSVKSAAQKYNVSLTWDAPTPGDTMTDYYRVFVTEPGSGRLRPATDKPIYKNSFSYTIDNQANQTTAWQFAVLAVSKTNAESQMSDTMTVRTDIVLLTKPIIMKTAAENGVVTIKWSYGNEGLPIKGFRLFQNKSLIASEKELNKQATEFVTGKLENGNYEFTLRAVGEDGILSEGSTPASVTVSVKQ